MYRINPNIFQIENSDIQTNQFGSYIEIEDYIDCTITYQSKSIDAIIYYHNENNNIPAGYKRIFIDIENININELRIIINTIKSDAMNHNFKINKNNQDIEYSITPVKFFHELTKQNINLSINQITYREEDLYQNIDIDTPADDSYEIIKISNIIVFNKEEDYTSEINYLPQKNQSLQKIYIKIKSDDLIRNTPQGVQFQLYIKDEKAPLFQIKNAIATASVENYKYIEGYGFQYGIVYDKTNIAIKAFCNQFGYGSDTYVFEWAFTEEQSKTIMNYYNNNKDIQFIFKCRYASEEINNHFIWRGWSPEIKNIKINTPPSPPSEIRMEERTS